MAHGAHAVAVLHHPRDELHGPDTGGSAAVATDAGELPALLPVALRAGPFQDRLARRRRDGLVPSARLPGRLLPRALPRRLEAAGAHSALHPLLDELRFAHVRGHLDPRQPRPAEPAAAQD